MSTEGLQSLRSRDVKIITGGLESLSRIIAKNKATPEIIYRCFPDLVKLLDHNHYKIRVHAFKICKYFLTEQSQYVIDSIMALKSCLSGMNSIKEDIIKCAEASLAAILDLDEPQKWWPEVEIVALKGKSANQRVNLLKILASHGDEIPLATICKLLRDPNIRVQRAALAVLESVDPYRVQEAMKRAREQQENEEMGVKKDLEPEPIPCVRARPARHRPQSMIITPVEMSTTMVSNLSDFVSSSEEEIEVTETANRNFEKKNDPPRIVTRVVPAPPAASKQRARQPEAPPRSSVHVKHQSPIRARKEPQQCVGNLPIRKVQSKNGFKLRDLSDKSWLERKEFLEELNHQITEGTLSIPPEQILDCAMTCASPVYLRVVPILCSVLANLIVSDPQILSPFIDDILRFVLTAFRQLGSTSEIDTLLEALYLEADPNEVVSVCVDEAQNEARPLHIETFLLKWFAINSDIELERPVFLNLMSYLTHNAYAEAKKLKTSTPRYMSNVNQILTVISRNQQQIFIDFVLSQPQNIQQLLAKYIHEEAESAPAPEEKQETSIPEIENPISTIRGEFRKRANANILLLAHAFSQLEIHSESHLKSIFNDLIVFLGQLSDDLIQRETANLRTICGSVFASPGLMKRSFDQEMIPGLSVFVWNCGKEVLAGAEALYPDLYALFKKAPGAVRTGIVVVTLAIGKATGKSFKEMKDVHPAHKKLIEKIETQFM